MTLRELWESVQEEDKDLPMYIQLDDEYTPRQISDAIAQQEKLDIYVGGGKLPRRITLSWI